MMCHKKCECNNNNKCDPQTGECLSENAKILFGVLPHRSSNIMKLSSNRIKAQHWIPVHGNGKINIQNCSEPDRCNGAMNKKIPNESTPIEFNENNHTALIHELNSNLSNLTKELKKASDNSVAIVVDSSIAIHHIHEVVSDDDANLHQFNDLLSLANTDINSTENQQIIYDEFDENGTILESIDHQVIDDSDEVDSIGGHNDVIHVFSMRSVNTTKSVRK